MEPQEKKYLVNSFDDIQKLLHKKGAIKGKEVVATHFYGQRTGNDVEKFVEYADRIEVHVLKESDGRFTLIESIPIANKEAGFSWLKSRGYQTANIVKMAYTEYSYKEGTVGLYIIDDFLHSIVLDYPPTEHAALEKEFTLESAEVIRVPYNKYLEKLGRLGSINV